MAIGFWLIYRAMVMHEFRKKLKIPFKNTSPIILNKGNNWSVRLSWWMCVTSLKKSIWNLWNGSAYIHTLLEGVWQEAPQHFITSSSKNIGREELLNFIEEITEQFFEDKKK